MKDNLFLSGDSNAFAVVLVNLAIKARTFLNSKQLQKRKIVQMFLLCALTFVRIVTLAHV
jgi:hypothetical protein